MGERPGDGGRSAEPARPDGWGQNERYRRAVGLDATPAERLAWLEEAIALAYRSGALPKPVERGAGGDPMIDA